ncbi:MAG: glycosyltransferase [Steroidobacteraceae bacterium]
MRPLVSVIIPAYNASATLDETLHSARAQTYSPLEIVVVDDGSTDATAAVASRHAACDGRVRVLRRDHRGHAAARNTAIAAARGTLIAPLDADDLWRPRKIELQVAALQTGGQRVGLVYTWFASVDEKGRIRSTGHRPTDAGEVLRNCCRRNLVGNGSGALMPKHVILECGGYDEALDGCEDLKLYTAIAARYHYAVVPEHLTGYRQSNANVTSNVGRMHRDADRVIAQLEREHPQFLAELGEMRLSVYEWLFSRAVLAGRVQDAARLLRALWSRDRSQSLLCLISAPKIAAMRSWYRTGRPLARGLCGAQEGFSVPRFLQTQDAVHPSEHLVQS